ncbi:hypothetical protein BY996DRAFT_8457684, partial [Phakopsora pachyrhizi]
QSIPNSISQPESPNDLTRKHQSEVASEKSHLSTKSPHGSSELSTIHADGIAAIDARITTRPKFSPVLITLALRQIPLPRNACLANRIFRISFKRNRAGKTGPSRACKAAARGRGGPAQANSGTRVTIQSEPVLPNPVPIKLKVVQRGKGSTDGSKSQVSKLYRPAKFSPLSDFLGEKSLDTSSTSIDANKSSGEASASVKKLTKSNQDAICAAKTLFI